MAIDPKKISALVGGKPAQVWKHNQPVRLPDGSFARVHYGANADGSVTINTGHGILSYKPQQLKPATEAQVRAEETAKAERLGAQRRGRGEFGDHTLNRMDREAAALREKYKRK